MMFSNFMIIVHMFLVSIAIGTLNGSPEDVYKILGAILATISLLLIVIQNITKEKK